ncbi:hypothetical protein V491_06436 [Pseudogymnoascus sp. VKM F-3775]|nr:hypothetical protein V491_06436 [Pseudogymnoascus sp. VKM F-3775]
MPETTPPNSDAPDPSPYEEAARRSTSTSRYAPHGRGGAGMTLPSPFFPFLPPFQPPRHPAYARIDEDKS